jgi:chromosome segregation ATPase
LGLFDENKQAQVSRQGHRAGGDKDASLFDWLVKKAEADLGLAQAFAASECHRAKQIKNLEASLIGQITALQQQVVESREAELNALKSEIFACSNRLERVESQSGDATKEFIQDKLGSLRAQLIGRQTELETRYSGFEKLSQSLAGQIRALEEQVRRELAEVEVVRAELHHWKSEANSLAERVGQAESTAWQSRALASRNAQHLEQTVEQLKSGMDALNERWNELNERGRNTPQPAVLVKELAKSLGSRIEDILARLAEQHQAQLDRDGRLASFDAGLAAIAERLAQTESLTEAAHTLAQREAGLTSDFRDQVARELAALYTQVGEIQTRLPALESLDSALRSTLDAWQGRAEQKFVLLENHWSEHGKTVSKLATAVDTKLATAAERTDAQLEDLRCQYERLLSLEPDVRTLQQRTTQLENATNAVHEHAETVARLEKNLDLAVSGLRAELATVNQQERSSRLSDDQIAGIERKLGLRLDEFQRQMNSEREGFEHWGKGLRESFSAELSAVQARLSERQSQLEYGFARLNEQLKENVAAKLDFEAKISERLHSHDQDTEQWTTLRSGIDSLDTRADRLEIRNSELENRIDSSAREYESRLTDLCNAVGAIRAHVNQLPAMSVASVTEGLEETLHAALRHLDEQVNEKFSLAEQSGNERAERTAAAIDDIKRDLESCRALVACQQSGVAGAESLARDLERSLGARLIDLEQRVAEHNTAIGEYDRQQSLRTHDSLEALESQIGAVKDQITALQAANNQQAVTLADSMVLGPRETIEASIEALRRQVADQLTRQDQRYGDHARQTERLIDDIKAEITALQAGMHEIPHTPAATAFRDLEEALGAKVQGLRHEIAQKLDHLAQCDAALSQETERLIADVSAEVAAVRNDLRQTTASLATDQTLRVSEEALRTKIDELSKQVMDQRGLSERHDGTLEELSDRFQSLMQRVAQLSEAVHDPRNVAPSTVQPLPSRPSSSITDHQDAAPASNADAVKHEPATEKEQMVKLQERMSVEIERVRAELKERSGRWKVRRNVS